jgi:hypothetical protein
MRGIGAITNERHRLAAYDGQKATPARECDDPLLVTLLTLEARKASAQEVAI